MLPKKLSKVTGKANIQPTMFICKPHCIITIFVLEIPSPGCFRKILTLQVSFLLYILICAADTIFRISA